MREEYRQRYSDAAPSVQALIEALFIEPIFNVSRAAELIDMSYQAANKAVDRLEADGVVEEFTGQARYREFQASGALTVLNRSSDESPTPGELMVE